MKISDDINFNSDYSGKISNNLYFLKVIAIFFVICAHSISDASFLVSRFFKFLGTLGVPIFLVLSGYSFNPFKDKKRFWFGKIKNVVMPWFLWGTVTYLTSIVSNNNPFSISSLIKWIFGNGTWLYFVPVLLICFFVFSFSKRVWYSLLLVLLSIMSVTMTYLGIIQFRFITDYMNPFNWFLFFAAGIFVKSINLISILKKRRRIKYILFVISFLMMVLYYLFGEITYFSPFALLVELLSVLCLLSIDFREKSIFKEMGTNTYFVYFFHMQFGLFPFKFLISKTLNFHFVSVVIVAITPFLCLLLCYVVVRLVKFIAMKLKIDTYIYILGIR